METIEVTKEQKQMLEILNQIKDLSVQDILETLEDLSDKKIVEKLENDKKLKPNREFTTYDEIMRDVYGEDV